MTELLYSQSEGAYWERFESPLEVSDIEAILAFATTNYLQGGTNPPILRHEELNLYGHFLFIPRDDQLPKLHSILTREGRRWDAYNRFWQDRGKAEAEAAFEAVLKRGSS